MGRIVIAVYKPKPEQEQALLEVVREHVPTLRKLGLATERASVVMRSTQDRAILEVFEWCSPEAIEAAHEHPTVMAMWERFAELSENRPLASLLESRDLFAEFEPLPST